MKRFVNLETSLSWEVIYFLVNFEMLCNYIHLALNKGDDQMKLLVLLWVASQKCFLHFLFSFSATIIFLFSAQVKQSNLPVWHQNQSTPSSVLAA